MGFVQLSSVVAVTATVPAMCALAFRDSMPFGLTCMLLHVSSVGYLVALAASPWFEKSSTGLLGKRADGRIDTLRFGLFWPYHAGLRMKLGMQRLLSSEPVWNQITSDYFIGGWPNSKKNTPPLCNLAILDVTCELPLQVEASGYLMIPVWDTHAPSSIQIEIGVRWALKQEREEKRCILIHCAHGHGRSACMMAAILIAKGLVGTVEEAEAMMKKERPRVRLNPRQKEAVEMWLKKYGQRWGQRKYC